MSSILEMLGSTLGGGTMDQISRELGTEKSKASDATGAAVSTLLAALAKNASKPEGAQALHRALERDHDGSLLSNLGGLVGGQTASRATNGEGILRHVLGGKRQAVEAGLSKQTGMDSDATGKLLKMVAPMVLGALGKQQRKNNFDAGALAGFLGQEREHVKQQAPEAAGLLGKLLDSDGDGDFDMGDMAKHGAGLLGKLFNR